MRLETGPVQVNDDWPGIFIRGDNAAAYSNSLRRVLAKLAADVDAAQKAGVEKLAVIPEEVNYLDVLELHDLQQLLMRCIVGPTKPTPEGLQRLQLNSFLKEK